VYSMTHGSNGMADDVSSVAPGPVEQRNSSAYDTSCTIPVRRSHPMAHTDVLMATKGDVPVSYRRRT
jgi:hypothetical protein